MAVVDLEEHFHIANVTPEQCFEYLADIDNAGEWNTFVESATAEGEEGVGRVVKAKVKFLIPLPFEVKTTVVEYDKPSLYTLESTFPFTSRIGGRFHADDDGTRFTYFFQMEPTKFFPVPKVVLRKAIKVQFDKDGRLLKSCLQALAD